MSNEFRFFPKVGEIAHRGVVQLTAASTVRESVAKMGQSNLSDIIFSHEDGYSIFTVDDLLAFRRQQHDMATPLGELASSQLDCVSETENVLDLLHRFDESNSRYLGVVDERGALIGIVSYTDVLDSVDPSVMMERRTLADILKVRRIELIDGGLPTDDALSFLHQAEDAILITEQGALAGILTTKDVIRILYEKLDTSAPVRQYMTSPVLTINKSETVKGAITYLKERKFKRAIVVDDGSGQVIGVVSQRDLINSTYGRWADLMKLHAHELDEVIRVLEAKNRKLLEEALTDPLTGIGNRRRLNQSIEAEVGRYYRHSHLSFSLLMVDADHFKMVNDRMGHAFGDHALQHLCRITAEMLRVADTLGRWGGEEFVVLLPDTGLDSATTLAGRICKTIEESPFQQTTLTVSIGVAEYQKGESIEEFVARADEALYRAKNEGRNRVVCATR